MHVDFCDLCEKFCTILRAINLAYNHFAWGEESSSRGKMHWVKLLLEAWVLLGIVTVIVGLIWTDRQSRVLSKQAATPISPPKVRPEFRSANFTEARSA
jgi:hypothetical protein